MANRWQYRLRWAAKVIQFRYVTWRNKLEIARAYRQERPRRRRAIDIRLLKRAGVGICAAAALIGGAAGISAIVRSAGRAATSAKESRLASAPVAAPLAPSASEIAEETVADVAVPLEGQLRTWGDTIAFAIVANKAVRRMHIYQNTAGVFRLAGEYPIAVGNVKGRKQTAGDRRTPEGLYFIVGRKEQNELAPIYGPLAYVLNYPNEHDRRAGRTGEGIWIHGTAPDSSPVSTRGCLELDNTNLQDLRRKIGAGIGTPVLIVDDADMGDPRAALDTAEIPQARQEALREYYARCRSVLGMLRQWVEAWSSRTMAAYAACYDTTRFRGDGLTWRGWRERKQRTFDNYRHIEITLSDIIVFDATDTTATVGFVQHYASDQMTSASAKRMRLGRRNGDWKITQEATIPGEELVL